MHKNDKIYIQVAEIIAKKSTMHHKIGCCIVHKKTIVSTGHNRYTGHNPSIKFNDEWSLHAEAQALQKAISYIHDNPNAKLTIYVARKKKSLARPCVNCMRTLAPYITRFVYTSEGSITEEFLE